MFFQLLAVSALSCRGTARRGWHLLDCVCRYLNFNSKLQQNQAQNRIQPCLPFSPCPHSRPQAGRYPVSALGLQPGGSAATPKGIPGIPGESNRLIQKRHSNSRGCSKKTTRTCPDTAYFLTRKESRKKSNTKTQVQRNKFTARRRLSEIQSCTSRRREPIPALQQGKRRVRPAAGDGGRMKSGYRAEQGSQTKPV